MAVNGNESMHLMDKETTRGVSEFLALFKTKTGRDPTEQEIMDAMKQLPQGVQEA